VQIAVSSGIDSLSLHIIMELFTQLRLHIVNMNHKLRLQNGAWAELFALNAGKT
jgi:tRNA(Ile)-lysidine synthase TilS/MesJ